MSKKRLSILAVMMTVLLFFGMPGMCVNAADVLPFAGPLDYSQPENWLYDGAYPENAVDVFIVAPSVDTKSAVNSEITEAYRQRFAYAMNQQQALFAPTAKIYAPYYRQASLNAYALDAVAREQALSNAYTDVSAAFRYYLEHKNNGRPVILAGFSQGADMCYRLLMEYYGDAALRSNLVAVYAIGWNMTEEMLRQYPQIIPAQGETDTGVVVSFDCENGEVTDSLITPAGTKAYSINPLNWRTDSVPAEAALNHGSVTQDSKTGEITSVEVGKYGACIDPDRGTLIVSGIDTTEYPAGLAIFPEGSLHLYDNFLFFVNLQENVQKRAGSFLEGKTAAAAVSAMTATAENTPAEQNTLLGQQAVIGEKYTLYLGLNDKDTYEQIIPTDTALELANRICAKHAGGYTQFSARGGWTNDDGTMGHENTIVYQLYDISETDLKALLNALIVTFNQSSVLVEKSEAVYIYYTGE
ncbi:MAG: DUF3574 domain-containing protein [Lachnospiraceae bacterium]|nr:DUF3574 domain-containing protein [Lachnospiraceae bacterium]